MKESCKSYFDAVAEIHKKELGGSDFLSSCSRKFISFFYRCYEKDERNKLFTVEENGVIAGFAFLTLAKEVLFMDFVKSNIKKIIINPSALASLLKTLIFRRKSTLKHEYEIDIVYIAVSKKYQSKGFARKLLRDVEEFLKQRNMKDYYLQVFKDNENAVRFYNKYGFEVIEEYEARSRAKLLMKKDLIQ